MIQKAKMRDILALTEICNDAETKRHGGGRRQLWVHGGYCAAYVWEEDGCKAGYASLSCYRDRKAFDPAVELSIYIHEAYRGRGIGRRRLNLGRRRAVLGKTGPERL